MFAINILKNHSYWYIYPTLIFQLSKFKRLKFQFCFVFFINLDCITPDHTGRSRASCLLNHQDFKEFHSNQAKKLIFQ